MSHGSNTTNDKPNVPQMRIKRKHELKMKDFRAISKCCQEYGYNGLGIAVQGGWHPVTLEHSVEIITTKFAKNKKLQSMALDILLTLAQYYLMTIDFDKQDNEDTFNKYSKGYKYCVMIYDIISSEKMKRYKFKVCIRINAIHTILHYVCYWCLNRKSWKGIMKISYALSRYTEKYYPLSFKLNINTNHDPCTFASARCSFSWSYLQSVTSYYEQLIISQVAIGNNNEIIADFFKKTQILKKFDVGWGFVQREIMHIYQQKQIIMNVEPKSKYFGDGIIKLFLPKVMSRFIAYQCRIYCILRNEGYGIGLFFKEMEKKMKTIPNTDGETYESFHSLRDELNEQLQSIRDNAWFLTFAQIEDKKMRQRSIKYGNHSKYIINVFKSKRNVTFLKNFLRGKKCANCSMRKERLQICAGCRNEAYCSRKCQKRKWIQHRQICLKYN